MFEQTTFDTMMLNRQDSLAQASMMQEYQGDARKGAILNFATGEKYADALQDYNDEIERLEQEIAQLKEKGEPKDNSEIYYIISLVLMVTGLAMSIIRGFRYSLTNFLIFDNPDMKAKEIVNKSAELMKGNVGRIFRLNLSFIGWFVLVYIGIIISGSIMMFGSLPFGDFTVITLLGLVGYIATLFVMVFFLTPYIQMANICFYEELVGTRDEVIDDTENAIM